MCGLIRKEDTNVLIKSKYDGYEVTISCVIFITTGAHRVLIQLIIRI